MPPGPSIQTLPLNSTSIVESLNVAGTFVDLADPLHWHVFGFANTTINLNGVGAHSFCHLGGV
jgi:hypothetical protein